MVWSNVTLPQPPSLWKFTADNIGGGTWSHEDTAGTLFPSIQPTEGLQTSGKGVGYYLGGALVFETYPQQAYGTGIAVQGLIEFNTSTGAWSNLPSTDVYTTANASGSGQAAYGGAHFVPTFGEDGLVVFFGVRPPIFSPVENATYGGSMTEISVFDPFSKTWFTQIAAGPSIPNWRANFCTTGVVGDNNTYEMFVQQPLKRDIHIDADTDIDSYMLAQSM